jgi:hypothetical protein
MQQADVLVVAVKTDELEEGVRRSMRCWPKCSICYSAKGESRIGR